MRHALVLSLALAICSLAVAQDHFAHQQAKPATLMSGYGDLLHPVSTKPASPAVFDQVRQIFAFNYDEARARFSARRPRSQACHGVLGGGRGSRPKLQ